MRKNILLRTNLLVCTTIILGCIITTITGYHSNMGLFKKDAEHVTELASEGIVYQIESNFTNPISIAQTMANDILLKRFLAEESEQSVNGAFMQTMREYLGAYHNVYGYDSVFLVSAKTLRYYHFNGLVRVHDPDEPESQWYYALLSSNKEYVFNIDNDEANENQITTYINYKIKGDHGEVLGAVGVGFRVDSLQKLLKEYEEQFGVRAYLVDSSGIVQVSADLNGHEQVNLFDRCDYSNLKEELLDKSSQVWLLPYSSDQGSGYVTARYLDNLGWNLIVENNTSALDNRIRSQLFKGIMIVGVVLIIVLLTITTVIRRYNAQIIELTAAREQEYYEVRQEAAKEIYESIYEMDITHNCIASGSTEQYFESLSVPADTPYDEGLKIIAAKQIKEEFRQGYLDMFSPANVLAAYQQGIRSLSYEFMITTDGDNYYWMRVVACIYFWSVDKSIRMTTYRQNIDRQKSEEMQLFKRLKSDSLTGLYNKSATKELICEVLAMPQIKIQYAFLMLDIDRFKHVNDNFGHAVGDYVIAQFAKTLKVQFRDTDIVGRIGGDEFAVFLQIPSLDWLEQKVQMLVKSLNKSISVEAGDCNISTSIGVSVYPEMGEDFETLYKHADTALYQTKEKGRNGYTIYKG